MSSENTKNLSEFGQAALKLDSYFAEFERLSGLISRLEIESDNGLERAQQGLGKFGECGENIGQGIQELARTLEEMRRRAEDSAKIVAERTIQVQERRLARDRMIEQFRSLTEKVQSCTANLAQFKKPKGHVLSHEERAHLPSQMMKVDSELRPLIEEAHKLKEDARNFNMKTLERNAESMGQSLESARRKLASAVEPLYQPE